jgi:hypothetical protein
MTKIIGGCRGVSLMWVKKRFIVTNPRASSPLSRYAGEVGAERRVRV